MGLCKCPKKRVTNQFCFEHRVNVCEHCLVSNHPKCIIQSYLKWLQDSDYEPICQLCKQDLSSQDCIRLLCYDVFHWSCFDQYAKQLPPQTAPAGYSCPSCQVGLFPAPNLVSPVADALRQTLNRSNWARMGLGLSQSSIIDDNATTTSTSVDIPSNQQTLTSTPKEEIKQVSTINMGKSSMMDNYSPSSTSQTRLIQDRVDFLPSNSSFNNYAPTSAFTSRSKLIEGASNGLQRVGGGYEDHDENKYKRKSPIEMFSRWFKSRAPLRRNRFNDPRLIYKRWFILTILIFLGICTLILIFVRLGRGGSNYDPLLDPKQNPNIRVGDGAFGNDLNPDSM